MTKNKPKFSERVVLAALEALGGLVAATFAYVMTGLVGHPPQWARWCSAVIVYWVAAVQGRA